MTEMSTIRDFAIIHMLWYVPLLICLIVLGHCFWVVSQISEVDIFMAELDLRFFYQCDEVPVFFHS